MRRLIRVFLLIACSLILFSVKAEASSYKTGYIVCEKPIKMYKKASVKSKVVRKLCNGKKVKYKYYKKGWYYCIRKGKKGYVRAKYVSDTYKVKKTERIYSPGYFMQMGVIYWNGWRWTWYSQKVLPGGGLRIPGRHVDADGYVCDEHDYICVASSVLSYGTVVATPFGKPGKVYDNGCSYDTIDTYTNWP